MMLSSQSRSTPIVSNSVVMQSRQEVMLLDYVERLERYREDRRAVHLHLSTLQNHNRVPNRIRIAANMFESLLKRYVGQLFRLESGDIFLILKEASFEEINECVAKVRELFRSDPLMRQSDTETGTALCSWYNLATEYGALLEICKNLIAVQKLDESSMRAPRPGLEPGELAELQARLEALDLSSFLQLHQICAVKPGSPAKLAFVELRISVDALISRLWPRVDPGSSRWLLLYLNDLLGQRLFDILPGSDMVPKTGAYSIHLNTASLISEEFMRLDAALRKNSKRTIMIVLRLIDVYADLSTFQFARDFARQRGYHICLDGLTYQNIHFIDRARLGAELVKLAWQPNLELELRSKSGRALRGAIKRCEKERVILGGCEAKRAIEVGWSMGVTMFEGPYIDSLLASNKVLRLPRKAG